MHLGSAAAQQVNEGRVEGHDGVSQMHAALFLLLLTTKPAIKKRSDDRDFLEKHVIRGWVLRTQKVGERETHMKRLSFLIVGPSLAGSSEILMASSMAASRPLPPSPRSAGPKHSGRRMRRRTTTLAFSSTLSPMSGKKSATRTKRVKWNYKVVSCWNRLQLQWIDGWTYR